MYSAQTEQTCFAIHYINSHIGTVFHSWSSHKLHIFSTLKSSDMICKVKSSL